MTERISQPSRSPMPRKERTEVRFALSYEALKMKSISSAAQISAILFAMRQANFSDSITHGPRMNTGRLPPMTTLPTRNDFAFSLICCSTYHRDPSYLRCDDNHLGQAIFSNSWMLTIARNITQTIECDQSSNVSLLASLRINAC